MLMNNRIGLVLLSAVLAAACGGSATAPTSPTPSPPSPPLPPGPAAEVWNVTARLTAANGGGCMGDAMVAEMDQPKSYVLSITPSGSGATVTFRSVAGDHLCKFTGATSDSTGFTTVGKPAYFSCEAGGQLVVKCADGTQHFLMAFGADIFGTISGSSITGKWMFDWGEPEGTTTFGSTTEFTGNR